MSLKIGNNDFKHGLVLAPMAGVTDRTFRNICASFGAEYAVSEMVCAKSLCYEQKARKKTRSVSGELATILEGDIPTAIQIFGSEPEYMAEAAKMLADGSYNGCCSTQAPIAIDINMGCPVRKITANGEGSALMKNPVLAGKIVRAVVKSVDIPVTVKIRAGWDDSSKNAVEMAKIIEENGASAICLHARTKEQLYRPGIDIDLMSQVKSAVNIAVIGNGDIYSARDAIEMFKITDCDGIMIGRGAMGNPWIFSEITCALRGNEYIPVGYEEKITLALSHLKSIILEKGERIGIAEGKKHVGWYVCGMDGAASARNKIMTAVSFAEIEGVLNKLLERQ